MSHGGESTGANGLAVVNRFKEKVVEAVTSWVKTTQEGQDAWADSQHDFNIGDLSNSDLCRINGYLELYGISIVAVDAYSMDASSNSWSFDTVLVDGDALQAPLRQEDGLGKRRA